MIQEKRDFKPFTIVIYRGSFMSSSFGVRVNEPREVDIVDPETNIRLGYYDPISKTLYLDREVLEQHYRR